MEAFNSLLRYIYYGETKLPPQDSLYLFQAACFYGLSNSRLHSFCKYSLEHNINYENVLQTLEASDITKVNNSNGLNKLKCQTHAQQMLLWMTIINDRFYKSLILF